jgi:hypothetical protein
LSPQADSETARDDRALGYRLPAHLTVPS